MQNEDGSVTAYERDEMVILVQLPRQRILLYKKPIAETKEKADSPL